MRAVLAAVSLGIAAYSSNAGACLYERSEVLRTLPSNGTKDVPTDVALLIDVSWYLGLSEAPAPDFARLRVAGGSTITADSAYVALDYIELRPQSPLEPNTKYEVLATAPSSDGDEPWTWQMTFTTGEGATEVTDRPLEVSLQHWAFADDVYPSFCDTRGPGTCVAVPDGVIVEMRPATHTSWRVHHSSNSGSCDGGPSDSCDGGPTRLAADVSFSEGAFGTDIGATRDAINDCVQLRQRHANGAYGEPIVVCGEQAPRFTLFDNPSVKCTANGIEHSGRMSLERKDVGCAVSQLSVGPQSRFVLLHAGWLALALFGIRRRVLTVRRDDATALSRKCA